MEEEAPSQRSVSELAGKFKSSAPPHDAAGHETEKPVRRRPPRSLQIPKTHGEDQQPPGVTSPLPAKSKRNSALIEKLQANLALSPSALMPSPKSPGFRLLPPAFPPPSPGSVPASPSPTVTPTSPVPTSLLTEEEGPTSFDTPPTVGEGSMLSNSNLKDRARHSIRRRPPSRRHRKSSSTDEAANEGGDVSPSEPEDKTTGEGGGRGDKDVGGDEDSTDASTCPDEKEDHPEISVEPREEEENKKKDGENESTEGKEEDRSSSGEKEEEKNTEKQDEAVTGGATKTDSEEVKETTSHCSVR